MQRAARLLAGLVLFAVALAMLVKADLGLDPWNVLSQGLSRQTGLSLGTVTVIVSLLLLLLWIPLGQRPGVGTIANALVIGPVLDLGLLLIASPGALAGQVALMLLSFVTLAIGTGLYVGAGWGPGPRDGLMTGLAAKGVPIARARAGIEISALVAGYVLGGTVGIATLLFALSIGALVKFALAKLSLPPRPPCPVTTG